MTTPTFLLVHEVATLYRVSICTVYRWVRSGRLPHVRPGGRKILIRASDAEKYLTGGDGG